MTTNMCNPDKILNYFYLKEILKITREYLIIKKNIDSRQKRSLINRFQLKITDSDEK